MTVIHDQPTCPGDPPPKRVQFLLTCNQSPDSHRTQVWLCFLILSVLCSIACAYTGPETGGLQQCLENLKNAIEKSDAMLYAPSINDIKEDCESASLRCYMLELKMVLEELEIRDKNAFCVFHFMVAVDMIPNTGSCPACEAHALKNSTIFLERLNTLLNKLNQKHKTS
uniref:Interleukin n=1 Tax=Sphaeramia orbicularis TaxID=375764 RepID=A0A672YVA5_9TELE